IQSPYASLPDLKITELNQNSTTTNQVSPLPSYIPTGASDFLEISGAPNLDISGYTIEKWTSNATSSNNYFTFPQGATLSPNGTVILTTYYTGSVGSSVSIPSDYYYVADVQSTGYSSTTASINIIRDPEGGIVDVLLYGSPTVNVATGITT